MTAREAVQLLLMLDCNQEFGQPRVAITLGYCQAVRHSTLTAAFAGPNPATPASKKHLRKQVLFATKSADGGRNPPAVDEIASR